MKKIFFYLCGISFVFATSCVVLSADKPSVPADIAQMVEKYPESRELVEYYREMLNDPNYFSREIDISSDLASDEAPVFLQWDKRWAFHQYGRETLIATSGCAPVCLSMTLCYFKKDSSLHPKTIADFSFYNNFYIERVGTRNELFTQGAKAFGLDCAPIRMHSENIYRVLDEGKLIVALMGGGHFTREGHFILIRGYDDKGRLFVNDPNSRINSRCPWNPAIVVDEARQMWELSYKT